MLDSGSTFRLWSAAQGFPRKLLLSPASFTYSPKPEAAQKPQPLRQVVLPSGIAKIRRHVKEAGGRLGLDGNDEEEYLYKFLLPPSC